MDDDETRRPETVREDCPDCHALPSTGGIQTSSIGRDNVVTEMWHTESCPAHLIWRIRVEDGAARVKEQDARAREAFPAAYARLQDALAESRTPGQANRSAEALAEL